LDHNLKIPEQVYENVGKLRYLETKVSSEIKNRSILGFLIPCSSESSRFMSENVNTEVQRNIFLPVVLYWAEHRVSHEGKSTD
jgi:hypothetical protein